MSTLAEFGVSSGFLLKEKIKETYPSFEDGLRYTNEQLIEIAKNLKMAIKTDPKSKTIKQKLITIIKNDEKVKEKIKNDEKYIEKLEKIEKATLEKILTYMHESMNSFSDTTRDALTNFFGNEENITTKRNNDLKGILVLKVDLGIIRNTPEALEEVAKIIENIKTKVGNEKKLKDFLKTEKISFETKNAFSPKKIDKTLAFLMEIYNRPGIKSQIIPKYIIDNAAKISEIDKTRLFSRYDEHFDNLWEITGHDVEDESDEEWETTETTTETKTASETIAETIAKTITGKKPEEKKEISSMKHKGRKNHIYKSKGKINNIEKILLPNQKIYVDFDV